MDGNVFVVLEGLSASGKTTIGRIVAELIRAEFYKTPPDIFAPLRDRVDREANFSARFLFYLAGAVQASAEISGLLSRRSVVSDRYLLTTLCYHRAVGTTIDIPDSAFARLLKPHFTFLIVCNESVRIQRLQARGLSFNDEQERKLNVERKFLEEYRKYHLIEIDNSSDNPSSAAEEIMGFLNLKG